MHELPVLITLAVCEDNVRELSHDTLSTVCHQRQTAKIIGLLKTMTLRKSECMIQKQIILRKKRECENGRKE